MLGKSYDQHLMAADTLDALLQRSREAKINSAAGAASAVRATEAGAPATFLSAIERNLQALYAVQVTPRARFANAGFTIAFKSLRH
jgi:hypothetical protein